MNALEISGLKKTYQGGVEALKGIDLTVKQGDFFALLGPNGAGKSTTIGVISSLVNKSAGKVKVFGHDIDTDLELAKSQLGLVPQEFNFSQFEKVSQIVTHQAGFYGVPRAEAKVRAEKYLRQLDLWDKRDMAARTLSGGMKRRLMIARALMHEPKLLILDEPTAGVDIEIRRSMWQFPQGSQRAGGDHHPDHPLPGRGRDAVPQHRHHRQGPSHREHQHEEPARQAGSRDLPAGSGAGLHRTGPARVQRPDAG